MQPIMLPYDIWALIAGFLPRENLVKLYSVNSAFFDLAMSARYHEVTVYHLDDESTIRCISNMDAAAASRVHTLTLRPHLFGKSMRVSRNIEKFSLREAAWNTKRWANKSVRPPTAVAARLILQKIVRMTNVTSVVVGCYRKDDWRMLTKATAFLDAAWTHSSRLKSLTLALPLEALGSILLPSIPTFGALEELNITLRLAYMTSTYDDVLPLIAAFINRHSSTLSSLSIDTPEPKVDPSSIFHALEHFSQLAILSVSHPFERLKPPDSTGVDLFMTKHANKLRELKLRFNGPIVLNQVPSPSTFFSHPIFRISFPSLTILDLGLCNWATSAQLSVQENLAQYLTEVGGSLTTLILRDYVLSFPEVQAIISVVGGSGSTLRSLHLHMQFLSCDLLDLLTRELPNLHHLELYFDCLISNDDGSLNPRQYWRRFTERAVQFIHDMQHRRYPNWALRTITIHPPYQCSGRWEECRQILVASLPSVISFNGLSASEFLEIPDYTKSR